MKRYIVLLSIGIMSVNSILGQAVQSFSLQEAIEYAYANHKDISIAANEMERAKQQMVEARAMGLPQLNLGVDYNYFLKLPTTLIPAQIFNPNAQEGELMELTFGTKNNLTAAATLSTLLFDGTYLTALKAGKKYIYFSKLNYENARVTLKNSVKKAYLPPLLIEENIKTIKKNIEVLDKLLFETREMYKAGFVEKLDVDKLALSVDNMSVLKNDLEKNLLLSLDALKLQIGFPLDAGIQLAETIEDLSAELDDDLLVSKMDYNKRSEYRVLDFSKQLSELNVERYKKGYWPSLSGFVNYQQVIQGDKLFDGAIATPTSVAGVSLKIPVFDGFLKHAKIQQAKLDVVNIEDQKEMLKAGIDFQAIAARKNYSNALENIRSRKQNVELAESIFKTSEIKYREGVGSSLEIIQAEQSLQQSQQNYFNALYNFVIAKIDFEIALGGE